MLLETQDVELFFKLHRTLMVFVNGQLEVIPDNLVAPEDFANLPAELRLKIRDALNTRLDLIQSFVEKNPAHLPEAELDIVRSWQHLVTGQFFVFREMKKYTVFLSTTTPAVAYGVVALSQPLEELIGPHLPVMVQTVLLPFKDRIVYDGIITGYSISFGPGIRRRLNQGFKEAKARQGVVTSLPISDQPMALTKTPKTKTKPIPRPKLKEEKNDALDLVLDLIDEFCRAHLNEEYALLCRNLAEKLARKRPSPLQSGQPRTWASGIVRTIGWVNFLHDKSQTPHMRLSDVDAAFGISESSGAARSAAIRKMLNLHPLDPSWTLPSRLDDNPLVWMLTVNGIMMDVRQAPREVQEIAFNKGLIPFIPADRKRRE
jgi:Domain of unknown function (DUF6398)